MRTIDELMKNATVTEQQYKHIREAVVIAARKKMIARKLTNVLGPLGIGVQTYTYDTMSEVSDALLNYIFQSGSKDTILLARSNANVPILHKEFFINRRDLESSRRFGTPLNLSTSRSASYKVSKLEDALVLMGYTADGTNYDINGFYKAANNTFGGADFATPGKAILAVGGAIAAMLTDSIDPPYNLVLNPTQYGELLQSVFTGGVEEMAKVKAMIMGDVYWSTDIVAGTGMMLSMPGAGFHEIILGQDITVEVWDAADKTGLNGRVYEAVVPVIYDTNSICTLTGI